MLGALIIVLGVLPAVKASPAAPLADAVEKRDSLAVRALLRDSNIDAAQADGMTALHWAVQHDDIETTRALLAAKANPNAANRYDVRPLSIACTNGNAAIVSLLLEAGADPNAALHGGETPLMTAARTGRLEPVQALLKRGVDANARLANGQTALMWAAADGHTAVVKALMKAGADFRTPLDISGLTPMMIAARGGHTEIVRAMLQAGVDVNEVTTPKTLKKDGRLPRKGTSALLIAIESGHFELASLLLDLGANPSDMRSGYAPLHVLSWVRKANRGDDDDGIPEPVGSGKLTSDDLIRKLAAKGADLNARLAGGPSGGGRIARKGCTAFMMAADTADTPFMKLLVELGADPTIPNAEGCTPIMAAAGLGTRTAEEEAGTEDEAIESVTYLLSLGADINAVAADRGDTTMHGAAFASWPRMVKFLAAHGAKIEVWNRPNKRGWTPLRIAEGHRYGNFKPSFETAAAIREVMIENGVTPPPPMPREEVKGYGP